MGETAWALSIMLILVWAGALSEHVANGWAAAGVIFAATLAASFMLPYYSNARMKRLFNKAEDLRKKGKL